MILQARYPLMCVLPLAFTVPVAQGQLAEPEVLLRTGATQPELGSGIVEDLRDVATNSVGGFACAAFLDDGGASGGFGWGVGYAWGAANSGSSPGVLTAGGTFAGYQQEPFWQAQIGLSNNGEVAYSVLSQFLPSGAYPLPGVWINEIPFAVDGAGIPGMPGKLYGFPTWPSLLPDGTPAFLASVKDFLNPITGRKLFLGHDVVLESGATIPGVPGPIELTSGFQRDFKFTPDGLHYIIPCNAGPSILDDVYLVVDGAGVSVGGASIGEGILVPPSVGGDGSERWSSFSKFGIQADGTIAFTGQTDGDDATNAFLFHDSTILLREGDLLSDGSVLTGTTQAFELGPAGEWALVWSVDGATGPENVLLINGLLALREGQEVDLNGDGIPEPDVRIVNFGLLSLASDGVVYVLSSLEITGEPNIEALLKVQLPPLSSDRDSVSLSSLESAQLQIVIPGDVEADLYLLLGSASGTSPGLAVDGVHLPLVFDAYTSFTLTQTNGPALTPSFATPGPNGLAKVSATPGILAGPSAVGLALNHAYVTLSLAGGSPVVSFASNAVELELLP